jgi:glutamate synthase (NADPH/NADH) large chain
MHVPSPTPFSALPAKSGLYDPRFEHDACGVSFVVDIKGRASHHIVSTALGALCNLEHRGATGAEANTGDGAGLLIQMPDRFFRAVVDFDLPPVGSYGVGLGFLPLDPDERAKIVGRVESIMAEEGLQVLGWRDVEVDDSILGNIAKSVIPAFSQIFVSDANGASGIALDRLLFVARKRCEHEIREVGQIYFPSLSCRTLVYKGMLTAPQVQRFFPELNDERIESALALVHSRFSTNTFPSWPLAHPYRYIAHNGEINTLQGNRNFMRAREALMETPNIPALQRAFPIITDGASDTASFDECLELLHLAGRPIWHAILMMIPEAWENHATMSAEKRAFYRFHSSSMEAWDGPASIAFTDGTVIGAVLDRNGLRPSRYWVTDDDRVIMASETGVVDIDPARVVSKGRLQPGRMFLVDTAQGRIVEDEEIKSRLASEHPYAAWLDAGMVHLNNLPERNHIVHTHRTVVHQQATFGYTHEELKLIIAPMAKTAYENIGSMGTDTPVAVLSERPRLLFDYFQELFAQVTNPPLDAIREELVTSLSSTVGPEGNLLMPGPDSVRQIEIPYPIIDNDDLAKLISINEDGQYPHLKASVIYGLFPTAGGGAALKEALDRVRQQAVKAIEEGVRVLVLSDRGSDAEWSPIPSLLLTSTVHHHLIREKLRSKVGLVVEAGDAREVHHMALLVGYGAAAINPYLAFESIEDMIAQNLHSLGDMDPDVAVHNYIKAAGKGVLKVMSKMGISTIASYCGAQVFEAIGLSSSVVDEYFTGTVSRIEGVGLDQIAEEVARRQRLAYPDRPDERAHRDIEVGGEYQWRREGEYHLFNPETVYKLQHATRSKRYDVFREYTRLVDDQSTRLATLRGLFRFKEGARPPVPIEEVEPVGEIVKRFATGAMSYGSISKEAHETLAIAMNRIGGKSNTGEGGEDADRYVPDVNGDLRRSAIKQVASGRFGVTSEYLVNADDLQIKMAQGAKPGEGGQLPGGKVYPWIAKTRHSTPGVGLISPPPHHDIYSIEDIKQLIHDLKNSNPQARVHVKLVAQVGVGTVAAGVAKAKSDVVLISGHDGGTGAAPLTSLKHAGAPWELGLAETQQTLVRNGLRDRIVVQCDGQLKTGRDVVIAALLGA